MLAGMVAAALVLEIARLKPRNSPAPSLVLSLTPVSLGLLKVIATFVVAARLNDALLRLPAGIVTVPVAVEPPVAVQSTLISRGAACSSSA